MSDMRVNNLNVDLIQDQASVSLSKQQPQLADGKFPFTAINVNVPLSTPSGQPEKELRRHAIDQAKRALEEALRTLEAFAA